MREGCRRHCCCGVCHGGAVGMGNYKTRPTAAPQVVRTRRDDEGDISP
jgi:hypothetical protein